MDVRRSTQFALLAGLMLLVQAGVPSGLAHATDASGAQGGAEAEENVDNRTSFPLTPERENVDQRHADMDGPNVVWQELGPDGDWDIMYANISKGQVSTTALTNTNYDEARPVIQDDRVAWEIVDPNTRGKRHLVVLDLATDRLHHVPDDGASQRHATFGGNGSIYYVNKDTHDGEKRRTLEGFDPDTGEVFHPIGDTKIIAQPAAYKNWIAWAQGSSTRAELHIRNVQTGNHTKVPDRYNIREGLEMGHTGLAWIASHGATFRSGSYTSTYNLTTGLNDLKTSVRPHSELNTCPTGVIWTQPGTSTTDRPAVALWDRFVDGTITFGTDTHRGICGADHIIYEEEHRSENESDTRRTLRVIDLEEVRLPREGTISIDEGDERSILRSSRTLEGTATPGDAREPITAVYARVDGSDAKPIRFERTDEGVRWKVTINPSALNSGRHRLDIIIQDEEEMITQDNFVFYTDTEFTLDRGSIEEDPDVPRKESAPFPLSLFNHYQDYQPFYNTAALLVLLIAAAVWFAYKRYREKPSGRPEYVPPGDSYP